MERNVLVDRSKGYACFLVLFGHVIMGVRLAGVNIPQFFEGIETFLWSFHVALFLFLSGVVYKVTGEWKGKKTKTRFVLHKLYSLGVPYVAFSVVYVFINSLVGATNTGFELSALLYIWKTPVAHYWFLYALFFLLLIWTVFSGVLKNWQTTLIAVAIGYIVPLAGFSLGSFEVVFSTAIAFGIGTFIDFSKVTNVPVWTKCLIVLLHIAASVVLIMFNLLSTPGVKELMFILGIYASVLFISMVQNCKWIACSLDFINRYSFQTYLLHTIFTAGVRIVMLRLHITQWWVHVLVGTICGLAFSVLVAKVAEKIKFLNFFFFPSKVLPIGERKRS